jgi:hypothetical protein
MILIHVSDRLNKGLEFFDGIIFLPVYNTALIILTAATGSVFYEEYKSQSLLDLGIFVIGCLVACAGVMVIAFTEAKPQVSGKSTIVVILLCLSSVLPLPIQQSQLPLLIRNRRVELGLVLLLGKTLTEKSPREALKLQVSATAMNPHV